MLAVAEREQLPVVAARAGSPEAWDALFQRYQLPLYSYVFELIRNEHIALDLVQETLISAARHLLSLRDDDRSGSWLNRHPASEVCGSLVQQRLGRTTRAGFRRGVARSQRRPGRTAHPPRTGGRFHDATASKKAASTFCFTNWKNGSSGRS